MAGMDELLELMEGPVYLTRNATTLSRTCAGLVSTFLDRRADNAAVRCERTSFTADELYGGLRRVCARREYRGKVEIHRSDGRIYLSRIGR